MQDITKLTMNDLLDLKKQVSDRIADAKYKLELILLEIEQRKQ